MLRSLSEIIIRRSWKLFWWILIFNTGCLYGGQFSGCRRTTLPMLHWWRREHTRHTSSSMRNIPSKVTSCSASYNGMLSTVRVCHDLLRSCCHCPCIFPTLYYYCYYWMNIIKVLLSKKTLRTLHISHCYKNKKYHQLCKRWSCILFYYEIVHMVQREKLKTKQELSYQ